MKTRFDKLFTTAMLSLLVATSACSRPVTDITANASDDVGPWDVANAKVNAEALTADVCMSDIDSADVVSERLLLQLQNKGFRQITLSMYSPDGKDGSQQRQVSWSADQGRQMRPASQAGQNPCASRNASHETSAEQTPESNSHEEKK